MSNNQTILNVCLLVLFILISSNGVTNDNIQSVPTPPLHVDGIGLVDTNDIPVRLLGVSWFGMEGEDYLPTGLWKRNWKEFLLLIKEIGFNSLRLTFSDDIFLPDSKPNKSNLRLNTELAGLTPIEIIDKIVDEAERLELFVILSRHKPRADKGLTELWYISNENELQWIRNWQTLSKRYADKKWVIGADIANEPHGRATWGTSTKSTDWRLAAERVGKRILKNAPHWLIFVQGIGKHDSWWGGDLSPAGKYPVRLPPRNLVYNAHVFGPEVYMQQRFTKRHFEKYLPAYWDKQFGYLFIHGIAPVVIGSFGVMNPGANKKSGKWFRSLLHYINKHDLSYFYWTLTPNSSDTGGILQKNWKRLETEKLKLLCLKPKCKV